MTDYDVSRVHGPVKVDEEKQHSSAASRGSMDATETFVTNDLHRTLTPRQVHVR
jgi:hypothetical protein